MPGVAPVHKVIQPFRHVVLPDHMKKKSYLHYQVFMFMFMAKQTWENGDLL